ncbi:MAG: hypothetical protein GY847_18535 [Proteobacteria bacterium]|nr:hypothetical protein [Pseudomonadota bacterium]
MEHNRQPTSNWKNSHGHTLTFWTVLFSCCSVAWDVTADSTTQLEDNINTSVEQDTTTRNRSLDATSFTPGLWPTLASWVPGLLLHGSGVFAAGDTNTGLKLLMLEGIGLLGMVGGAAVLASTGASRRLAGPTTAVIVAGFGLFAGSFLADLWGASFGGKTHQPSLIVPAITLALGYRHVQDAQFSYHHLTRLQVRLWLDHWLLDAVGWTGLDDRNHRIRATIGYRLFGPAPRYSRAGDGSFAQLTLASTYHAYLNEGFTTLSGELAISGRYDLVRLGQSLSGSFVEGELGWGREFINYDLPGLSVDEDANDMLLAGIGFGVYLGNPRYNHGEVTLYYDHRRDDYTGGMIYGYAGHVGLGGLWVICPDQRGDGWALRGEVEIGSAFYGGIDLLYRWGAR